MADNIAYPALPVSRAAGSQGNSRAIIYRSSCGGELGFAGPSLISPNCPLPLPPRLRARARMGARRLALDLDTERLHVIAARRGGAFDRRLLLVDLADLLVELAVALGHLARVLRYLSRRPGRRGA